MSWETGSDAAGPGKTDLERDYMQECMERLYQLDADQLRRLAWEALLISDGPDKSTDLDEMPKEVRPFLIGVKLTEYVGFDIRGRGGWGT